MDLRGSIISVIDLRSKLKINPAESNSETTIIILDLVGFSLGVVVDSVDAVVYFDQSVISEAPNHDLSTKVDYVVGVARLDQSLILILDLN